MMRAIRGKNTKPEMLVRRALHAAGYRFRLHRRDLPGTPDVVLPRYRIVVQVNGCWWHGHDCPRGQRRPSTNVEYWGPKLERNKQRQATAEASLIAADWTVVTVWECDLEAGIAGLLRRLRRRQRIQVDTS
jgi:DNA mismatch endonuclease (patch repair protein)